MKHLLKLLIVDDEKYVRNLLKHSIDWKELNILICGEADCAEEALQLVEELEPDIIFSDICMDYMDGIEFSKRVIFAHPYIKVVLLSGHDDFDFAAKGIEAGVSAYLLKPIEEEKVIDTIQKIKNTIYHEYTQKKELEQLKNYLSESKTTFVENCLNALMLNTQDLTAIIRRLNYLDITFSESFFQVSIIKVFPLESEESIPSDEAMNKEELQLWLTMECNNIIAHTLENISDVYLFYDLNHNNILLSNNSSLHLLDTLDIICLKLNHQLPCNYTIGIGQSVTILSQMKASYQTALEAINYRSILGNNQIIQYKNIQLERMELQENKVSQNTLENSISNLINAIRSEQFEEAAQILNHCIEFQISLDNTDIIPIRILVSAIIHHFCDLLLQTGLRNTDVFIFCMKSFERVYRLETIDELKNLSHNLTRAIIETFTTERSSRNHSLIDSILVYLKQNFSDSNLTLNSVASHFYLNASYLSRLFKLETSKTFTKHLTDIRLNQAAKLLLNSSFRAYEICEQVGFNDPKYFSTCFKKHFNMTTNEYRQVNLDNRNIIS